MLEHEKNDVYRVLVALGKDKREAMDEVDKMSNEEVGAVSERLFQLFKDWAYENDYYSRDECEELCQETAAERRESMMEAYS